MLESEYVCDYCSRSFTRKYNLLTHIENCHLNESCYCVICGQRFGSPAGLQLHLSRGHNRYGKALPECDVCGRIFTRKQNITSHMMTVHLRGLTPIRCNVCSRYFTTERNMKHHIRQVHNPKEFLTCDECQNIFNRKRSLMLHIQTVHAKSSFKNTFKKIYTNTSLKPEVENIKTDLKCNFCLKKYTSNYILKRHIRTAHILCVDKFNYYTCKFCSKLIIGKNNLRKHTMLCCRKGKHGAYQYLEDLNELNLICDTCNTSFNNENLLRQHIRKDHNFQDFYKYCKKLLLVKAIEKDYVKNQIFNCEFCLYNFGTAFDLKHHMNTHHNVEYFYSTCKVCYTYFFSKESILKHRKLCLPPADVKSCNCCDKMFTDLSSLEFHTRTFHPQIQSNDSSTKGCYECTKCIKVYQDQRSLKRHLLSHSNSSPESPDSKNKWSQKKHSFKSISNKNKDLHLQISKESTTHFGATQKCIECSTNFKEKRSLRRHIRIKHPNSINFSQCHICKVPFDSKKSCSRHLKTAHNMSKVPRIVLKTENERNDFYKCEVCNIIFKEDILFKEHKKLHLATTNRVPRCIICVKYFSSRKTLKRHIKKFHSDFQTDELADFGMHKQEFNVSCKECIKNFTDKYHFGVYQKWKHVPDIIVFKCETCKSSYNCLEYAIQRYKQNYDITKSNLYLSELCTAEMSDSESHMSQIEPISLTFNIKAEPESIKTEPISEESDFENVKGQFDFNFESDLKCEPLSPGEK